MRNIYISRNQLKKYWDTTPICIEFPDGTDALAQENGYTLEQCLNMSDVKFFLDIDTQKYVMRFTWNMSEKDWIKYKKNFTKKSRKSFIIKDAFNAFGQCWIGGICCDFSHTMDCDDWYAYTNLFYVTDTSDYGALKDGTKYDLYNSSPKVPLRCRTFESFKKTFEKYFTEYIYSDANLLALVNEKVHWGH